MKKTKSRGISEIKVKLLPEKAKRDYVLRTVSLIIVLVFIIINFFIVFLPRRDYINKLNTINSEITTKQSIYNNLLDDYQYYKTLIEDFKILSIVNNKNVSEVTSNQIDINKIFDEFDSIKPEHSFIELVRYADSSSQISISMQFDNTYDLTDFRQNLTHIDYILTIDAGSYTIISTQDGSPRYKTTFVITLDPATSPKVGDFNE